MVIGITNILYTKRLNLKREKLGKICALSTHFSHDDLYFILTLTKATKNSSTSRESRKNVKENVLLVPTISLMIPHYSLKYSDYI